LTNRFIYDKLIYSFLKINPKEERSKEVKTKIFSTTDYDGARLKAFEKDINTFFEENPNIEVIDKHYETRVGNDSCGQLGVTHTLVIYYKKT
jgi:hypothetical protein